MPLDGIPSLGGDPPGSFAGIAAALGTAVGVVDESESTADGTGDDVEPTCQCRVAVERLGGVTTAEQRVLVVDADDCPGDGDLAASPACRETVIGTLAERDVDGVRTRSDGVERTYDDGSVGLLLAAGRFVERVGFHDRALADRARRDPIAAARRAAGRAGAVARIAAESGVAAGADRVSEQSPSAVIDGRESDGDGRETDATDRDAFRAFVGPTLSKALVSRRLPADATQEAAYELPTNADVRRYLTDDGPVYHLRPVAHDLGTDAMATLAAAYDLLANGSVGGGPRAPGRAVRRVASGDEPVETLAAVLSRHTRGLGVLEHFFADERVSDVVVSAPVSESPIRVVVNGERTRTNVRLTPDGAAALASRFRRESGRSFSRSSPTLDAAVVAETGQQIRVAGVTAPASDGVGFAFRVRDDDAWTLPRLVAAGALRARAAAALSVAIERGAATIVAGTRGAGKTTLLSALLWELPASTRVVTIEDTPELPVAELRDRDRDVQALHTDAGGTVEGGANGESTGRSVSPARALRSALRLGDGALVVGEVRGEEAGALYEAMRVGAHGHAVLGTIHGDSAAAVRERVVSDLGVPASSFAATDLVVTCVRDGDDRHVAAIEEVRGSDGDASFTPLFDRERGELRSTGVLNRGDSAAFERLRGDGESHEALLETVDRRAAGFERLSAAGLTRPADRDRARGGTQR
ncbi:ATPase, T2SS/T4P/T4SS family [Halobellus ruber]|uniref:Type II/IV secretion system ATPase subunit n=1 Tax=Halobellus ruber TaxID=2761102 RepID=A0A7J9SLC4_9EURY|nr:ATPase, T2SS/T4P/T4SS family [Halobellus ruber]MBB6645831.1 type II/IV secretion system ATPase subunit [Halobellus ruber]